MTYITFFPSPLGTITAAGRDGRLTELRLGESCLSENGVVVPDYPLWEPLRAWLQVYFEGRNPGPIPVPLHPVGTPFQKQVWELLLKIPYGQTVTYGDLAREITALTGRPRMSAQAIGGAVGKNPIALLIPCHRVLGNRGSLTGYAYGLQAKAFLLRLEHSLPSQSDASSS